MTKLIRTDSNNTDFILLVRSLDLYLKDKDGEDHDYYAQYNKLDLIKHVIVAYENNQPVGCGAIKELSPDTMEIKRMFTTPQSRGKGIATKILHELEKWTAELGYKKCILETGKKQSEAIALYQGNGYKVIPNYG